MKHKSLRSGLMATTTICGAVLSTMAGLAVVATGVALPTTALAQDYTSGTMVGSVKDANGNPVVGATVSATSLDQGVVRTTTTDDKGNFQFPLIPTGGYSVSVSADGFGTTTDDAVSVSLGSRSGYDFTLEPATTEVVVKGKARPRLDFAATTTGTVVDVETLVKNTPVARNITALTMLAPSAVPGDGAFGAGGVAQGGLAQASVSGTSVAENVFYLNGLNITNFVNGIGGATVPFDFYKTVEVKTGGYQAEYGRGTGGVINAVSKSGTNEWEFAIHGNYQPSSMRSTSPDTASGTTAGQVGSRTTQDLSEYTFEAGGPILKDKLFIYGLYSAPNFQSTTATSRGVTYQETRYNDPTWGIKLDGYITADHHFELTALDTTQERATDRYRYTVATDTVGAYGSTAYQRYGGESYVGRYTGKITNWLTISAAVGDTKFTQFNTTNLAAEPVVSDARSGTSRVISRQATAASTSVSDSERKFYRADADLYFNLLGKHHVRIGLDHEETFFNNVTRRNGGQNWTYRKAAAGNALGLAVGQEYVQLRTFTGGGLFEGLNEAQYIQDSWDVTDKLNLTIGYRSDDFTVFDADGQAFSEELGNKAWRLGFTYDPFGDRSNKIFGFYGRYYLPVPSNTAFRAASNNLDVTQTFLPSGGGTTFGTLDPVTGTTTLGQVLTFGVNSTAGALAACQQRFLDRGIIAVPVGQRSCQVGSGGLAPSPESISALNVESTAEDEFILGYERRIDSLWKVGATLTYRELVTISDDMAIDAAVQAYCTANGYELTNEDGTGCKDTWTGTHQYLIANPGKDVLAVLSDPLPGETEIRTLSLSAEDLGYPVAERTYKALTLNFSRAWDGKWGLNGSYVLSESKGNIEGAVKSDTGQADAGITSDNDLIGFSDGAYGLLPNHHAHQIKLWGSYAVTDNFLVGFNYSGISGRKYGCNGPVPPSRDPDQISSFYNPPPGHYCDLTDDGVANAVLVPRGTAFETDFVHRFDVSVRYQVPSDYLTLINNSQLVLRADIFNLFDNHGITEAVETGNLASGTINADYMAPAAYQTPRFVRLGFDLTF